MESAKYMNMMTVNPHMEDYAMAAMAAAQPWSPQEDKQLESLVHKFGAKNWSSIADVLAGRTGKQCRERWRNHVDPSITREPFSHEEDCLVVGLVDQFGTKWAKIAKSLPGRTDNAIKNRYYSSLMKKSRERRLNRFTAHEDALIISLVRRLGTRWAEVSKFMPGRTSKSIKNRYYSSLKKSYPTIANMSEERMLELKSLSSPTSPLVSSPDHSCASDSEDDDTSDDDNDFVVQNNNNNNNADCVASTPPQSPNTIKLANALAQQPLSKPHPSSQLKHQRVMSFTPVEVNNTHNSIDSSMHAQLLRMTSGLADQDMVVSAVMCLCGIDAPASSL
eukprot:c11720_g1_i1.p1 GENE.c11720_g1_i1~~c11720_g1_i1.p1  ORF type:complete len:334 (+),score=85.61 c11720_g1_i1:114-1115(+)